MATRRQGVISWETFRGRLKVIGSMAERKSSHIKLVLINYTSIHGLTTLSKPPAIVKKDY